METPVRASETDTPARKKRYSDHEWDDKHPYLEQSWVLGHNEDYLEFLVEKVWGLNRPCDVVDFGCGYGRFGIKLMHLLPEGSTYRGFDESAELIRKAHDLWRGLPFEAEFKEGSVFEAPYGDDAFDLAVSHTVLMHVPDPEKAIDEMIRVTRDGGLVVTCDANRNAHTALFHIDETDEQDTTPLGLFQTLNHGIKKQTGVDHNIGVKTPVLMHRAGLQNVQARMTDSVRLLFPPIDTAQKEVLFKALCAEGYGPPALSAQERSKSMKYLTENGIPAAEAKLEIDREQARGFRDKAGEYHTVYTHLLTFSFGTVAKPGTGKD